VTIFAINEDLGSNARDFNEKFFIINRYFPIWIGFTARYPSIFGMAALPFINLFDYKILMV